MRINNYRDCEHSDAVHGLDIPLCTSLVLRLDFPLLSSLRGQLCG